MIRKQIFDNQRLIFYNKRVMFPYIILIRSERIRYMFLKKTVLGSIKILLPALLLTGCGKNQPIRQSGFYFDTVITVTLYDSSKTKELDHCFALADMYEQYFSAKKKDSDISRINAAAGRPVRVHDETVRMLEKGLSYCILSDGKFDLTVGKLTDLWDFHAENPKLPDAQAVADATDTIDYRNIVIEGNEVTLTDPDAALDTGGIAKGYIADKMKEYLLSRGITKGLINLGGNVLTIGEKEDGSAYAIGIQKPFDEAGVPAVTVFIRDQSVVTSGVYERFFEQDGIRYHHILDTSCGYPYENGLLSVTIICDSSADGDGLSTTCFALGLEKGMELAESLDHTEAVFITSDQKLHTTSGLGTSVPMEQAAN